MALFFTQPPVAATQALATALPRIANKPSLAVMGPAIGAALRSTATMTPARTPADTGSPVPAPVHIVGLQDLARGTDLRKAPLKLWTHLLSTGDDGAPAALADVDATTMQFAAVTEGDQVRSLGQNVRAAAAATGTGDYDLAVIRVPALYLSAVWLKGRNGAADVFIPSDSPKSPLTAGKRYSAEEFSAALKGVAEKELRETDPMKGG